MTEKSESESESKTKTKTINDMLNIKNLVTKSLTEYIESVTPLVTDDNMLYFLSKSNQLFGYDVNKSMLFEPNSSKKISLLSDSLDVYFNNTIKENFEVITGQSFDNLIELNLKIAHRDKFCGKKFFYSPIDKKIHIWSLLTNKWESDDILKYKYIFINSDIFTEQDNIYKPFNDLGIKHEDLQEIPTRFKDMSIHYYHAEQNKIYSLNYVTGQWYVPISQKQILKYVSNSKTCNKTLNNLI
jgi:hypothetical protein